MSVYLDYNSSAPIDKRVVEYMFETYKNIIGNADSRTHEFGNQARIITEEARGKVADVLKIEKSEVFFTSGATESINLAIQGLREYGVQSGKKHIITSTIEHKAGLETVKYLGRCGFDVDYIDPEPSGRISVQRVLDAVREDTLLVSLMHVNNETGIIQPVDELGAYLSGKRIFFHIDATQSFGKLVDELRSCKYDMLSMSAHKIGGPQGIGALILRRNRYKLPPIKPIMFGGQQEHGLRPGTTPVALVAGLGKACEIAVSEYLGSYTRCLEIKREIMDLIDASGIAYKLIGDQKYCIPSTLNICFFGVSAEALMLSTKQFCGISNGSACNSNSFNASHVLTAMGVPEAEIECCVRLSWGANIDRDALLKALSELLQTAKNLAL